MGDDRAFVFAMRRAFSFVVALLLLVGTSALTVGGVPAVTRAVASTSLPRARPSDFLQMNEAGSRQGLWGRGEAPTCC